jgi:hypothetical protein
MEGTDVSSVGSSNIPSFSQNSECDDLACSGQISSQAGIDVGRGIGVAQQPFDAGSEPRSRERGWSGAGRPTGRGLFSPAGSALEFRSRRVVGPRRQYREFRRPGRSPILPVLDSEFPARPPQPCPITSLHPHACSRRLGSFLASRHSSSVLAESETSVLFFHIGPPGFPSVLSDPSRRIPCPPSRMPACIGSDGPVR